MTKTDSISFGDSTGGEKPDKTHGKRGAKCGPTWRPKQPLRARWHGRTTSGHAMITDLLLCPPRTLGNNGGRMNGGVGRIGGLPPQHKSDDEP